MIQELLLELNLIGRSAAFEKSLEQIERFSKSDVPVLIQGETGTGKELMARALHYLTSRNGHAFIAVNCGALPDNLIESELFGHEKGAFTDAKQYSRGLIRQADKGTLFLDEIEALSTKGQVGLLRFLQNKEIRPVGGNRPLTANVGIVAATNMSLKRMVEEGRFRADLYYRLNIMPITVPPLRDRLGDIELLAEHFLSKLRERYKQHHKFLHPDSLAALRAHHWPGNVRELENLIHREFLLTDDAAIRIVSVEIQDQEVQRNTFEFLPEQLMESSLSEAKAALLCEFERRYLTRAIKMTAGNVTRAAKLAGKERRAFGKLLAKHGINKNHYC